MTKLKKAIELVKSLYHKINCYCGRHTWDDIVKPVRDMPLYYCYRICKYCEKRQSDTQVTCERAKDLLSKAKFLCNELAKFDTLIKRKTKTFMHLVNASKSLAKDYVNLKEDIRTLHIRKQKKDIREEKNEN